MNGKVLWIAIAAAGLGLLLMLRKGETVADIIKRHEGLRLTVYYDVAGYPTIGYGHKLLPGETFTTITHEQADALLQADIDRTWSAIKGAIRVPITDNQKAAVLSIAFNIGAGAFRASTLLKKINAMDTQGAAAEFARWNKATVRGVLQPVAGLTKRRSEEAALFMT